MKNCLKKTIPYILICLFGFFQSCNAITKKKKKEKAIAVHAQVHNLPEQKNEEQKINAQLKTIVGIWEIEQNEEYSVFSKVNIIKLDERHYQCTKELVDGSKHTIELILTPNYEFHSFNSIGEYYKVIDNKLAAFDRDGLIVTYTKKQ